MENDTDKNRAYFDGAKKISARRHELLQTMIVGDHGALYSDAHKFLIAAMTGDIDFVEKFLDQNPPAQMERHRAAFGVKTPLTLAEYGLLLSLCMDQAEVFGHLLEKTGIAPGKPLLTEECGDYPLIHGAVGWHASNCLKILLDKGVDVKAVTSQGKSITDYNLPDSIRRRLEDKEKNTHKNNLEKLDRLIKKQSKGARPG